MTAPSLTIDRLSVLYRTAHGEVLALDDVSVELERGEIVGLVGQTGSGKSTLVNAILNSLPRHQPGIINGSIRIGSQDSTGRESRALQPRSRPVTLVPQNTFESLNPLFRVKTQIVDLIRSTSQSRKSWLDWFGSKKLDDRVLKTLEAVQLPAGRQILERYPHQLSGGQRQRVMIAMALLSEPQVIIADEPTASLDVSTQMEVLKLFRRIASDQKISILLTTHNLGAAWEICDRVMVMHEGRIVESATRETFFANPRHPYTRSLLASASNPLGRNVIVGTDSEKKTFSAGCQFSKSCARALNVCSAARPPLLLDQPGHEVACYNPSTNDRPYAYDQP
ncbi:ABC transporter ATP-binding protein [Rhizobium johnstonii]|uniref:ABC transporter ATP-binding protein n=1 Tax=Rhizobium johnstonii TaxID=3019933 RepID=UPI003F9EB441